MNGCGSTWRRPVDEPGREQPRLVLQQTQLGAENQLVRREPFEHRDLAPCRQAKFALEFVGIPDPLTLRLETERKIAGRLQVRRHDLAETLGRGETLRR